MSFEPELLRDIIEVNPKTGIVKGQLYPFMDMAAITEWQRDVPLKSLVPREFRGSGSKFQSGDILLARITPCFENGKTAVAPAISTAGHGSTEFIVIRAKNPEDRAFIYALMRSEDFRAHAIKSMVGSSGRQRIPNDALNTYSTVLPAQAYRARASKLLCAIEDLCFSLKSQNTALESIAQTLFRSWFINFAPVHAKVAGNEPEAMSAELAALFPSEFEDSELSLIPKGWVPGRLSDICNLNPESWSAKTHPVVIKYVDLSGLKENVFSEPVEFTFGDAPSRARRVLRKGDSLYGTVRPGNLSYGFVGGSEAGLTGSTGFAVLRPMNKNSTEFVYCAMTLTENIVRLTHLAEGAAYPAVRPDIVHKQPLVVPSSEVMQAFHKTTAPLFSLHANNCRLVSCLVSLRDHLLPRLISGKLRIEDAEASVTEITSELEAEPV
ncbi:MAG: hypothetical protein P4L96_10155 [Rhodoferax sp.]|nr:hypothetical protein [Rhodoferax sp.]